MSAIQRPIFWLYWKKRKYIKFTKHQETRMLIRLGKLFLFLAGLIAVHASAMVYFEGFSPGDALWLSITTATTVGYGDFSAGTWQGRLITVICIYFFAISVLAELAAEFIESRAQTLDAKRNGKWRWKMKDHILIVNTPDEDTEAYLTRFISQIRQTPELKDLPIQLLTRKYSNGLPSKITEFGVVHHDGKSESNECLNAVNVAEAKYIIVLAKRPQDEISDSLTFDVLTRIKEIGTQAVIAAESVDDLNRNRMLAAGAETVMRPIRAYPELLVRAVVAPGTETVMENLFNHSGDHLARLDVVFTEKRWKDIIFISVENNYGLPLAYIGSDGIVTNPNPNEVCSGTSIICMVKEGVDICENDASNKLNATA